MDKWTEQVLPFAEMAPGSKVGMEEEWILGKPLG